MTTPSSESRPKGGWTYPPLVRAPTLLIALAFLGFLLATGRDIEMGRMVRMTGEAIWALAGGKGDSQVARGLGQIAPSLLPLQISERQDVTRIEGFDRRHLPWLSHLEVVETSTQALNPETLRMESRPERTEYLVKPLGYVGHVAVKLWETLEIALWGTVLAVVLSAPLAFFSAANLAPNRIAYVAARGVVSFLRAIPELVSALFLVLAYGFGPIAGVLALALHAAGFLGKFYAEDVESADPKPQEALVAIGANRLKVLRFAILPQVMPQYVAYTLYVLDRNFRMATVIGLVGAGGIGQELKGRFDMYNYHHVGTILVGIFVAVFFIDQLAARLRRRTL